MNISLQKRSHQRTSISRVDHLAYSVGYNSATCMHAYGIGILEYTVTIFRYSGNRYFSLAEFVRASTVVTTFLTVVTVFVVSEIVLRIVVD